MRLLLVTAFCFGVQFCFAQKLDIHTLEKILYAPFGSVDSMLKKSMFTLSEKQKDKGYTNYYYTSYERKDLYKHLLRSLSYMDVYENKDTLRIVLYRTYEVSDQEELKSQLLQNGYALTSETDNTFVYKKGEFTITNKVSEKKAARGRSMTAYEFELAR